VAPSFDHGVGDPVEGGVVVGAGSRVVLVEVRVVFVVCMYAGRRVFVYG
jgi:pantothenate kinase